MRTVTASANTVLNTDMGTEWIVLFEVDWVDNGTVVYSDQEFENALPYVIEMGGFDGSMMLTGSGDTQELDITLDDIDGSIREIYETTDVHKRPVRVYLQPKSLSSQHKILVFRGEIVTPIEWDESQRSIKFNILSSLNSKQVGFSMEEGDFPNIPDEALGRPWPLVFGEVCHIPAVKVRAPRRGYLETGVGIHDFTLEVRICQALKIQCPSQSTGNQQTVQQNADNQWTSGTIKTVGPDLECVNRRFAEICKLRDLYNQQIQFEYPSFTVYNGSSFPQNKQIRIYVDEAIFKGHFSGNVFIVSDKQHPEYATFNHQPCRDIPTIGYGSVLGYPQLGGTGCTSAGGYWLLSFGGGGAGQFSSATWVPATSGNFTSFYPVQTQEQAFQSCDEALVATPGMIGGPKDSWAYYDSLDEAGFFWAPAGTEVYMESENEILYIVSLLPGTVDGVAAYRQAPNGFRYLTEVPASRYTVYETDYEGYQVVEIGMNKQLSHYIDRTTKESEGWDDDIYVSFTSSVGPNPCDIIEWLVNKYTELSIDSTSFATVKAYLTNYPKNFYITSRPDVFELINDIAYQSRCAVYIRNNTIYIRYLSREPDSVRTITESDILHGTFVESLSETEDVYTTHNIQWSTGGAPVRDDQTTERKLVLKYNVDKYGTVEDDYEYLDNIYELALKTGTFWLIRKANSWKKVTFSLPLKHMDLDVGDCITLNYTQFSSSAVKVVIEQFTVDPDNHTVTLTCWTPIRSGESEPYYWAWPSQQSAAAIWPLAGDTHGGGGYTFNVTPPIGHLLTGGAHRDDQLIISSGDLHPSDLDDTLPSVTCSLGDYWNFNEKPPAIVAKEIAQSAAREVMENQISGGGNAGGIVDNKASDNKCGTGDGCNYKVRVQWHTSKAQGQATPLGGAKHGGPCGGPCLCVGGCPTCYGPIWEVCHTFGSPRGAQAFGNYMQSVYGEADDGWWECDETRVLSVHVENGVHGSDTYGQCEDVSTGAGANQDNKGDQPTTEKKEPTGKTGNSTVLW